MAHPASVDQTRKRIVNRPVLQASGRRPEVRGQRADATHADIGRRPHAACRGVAIVGAVTALLSHAFFDRRDACAMSVFSNAERATSA